jgi:hypothetical protein
MGIWKKLKQFPPVLVRLMGRDHRGNALTEQQIVAASNGTLTLADIRRLSLLTSWDEVSVRQLESLTKACGIDFANRAHVRNANRYLKRGRFDYLKRDAASWPYFQELLATYAEHLRKP